MWSQLLQDWTQVGGDAANSLVQSEDGWIDTEDVQDGAFLVEVSYATGTQVYLTFETAPAADASLFVPMQKSDALNIVPLAGSSAIQACLANGVAGPPISRFVRWKLTGTSAWAACFKITMIGI